MHLVVAQPLSPSITPLLAKYERLHAASDRATTEEERLRGIFQRDRPRSAVKAEAFRAEIGLSEATAQAERLANELEEVALQIANAVPDTWADLALMARVARERNDVRDDGATNGVPAEIPDFARLIERLDDMKARAEAADAILVEMVARYEAMTAEDESRPEHDPTFDAAFDRLYVEIATWCPRTLRGLAAMAKAARLRDDDGLRNTVAVHAEQLGELATAPSHVRADEAEGMAFGTLLGIARDADRAYRRAVQLSNAHYRLSQENRALAAAALKLEEDQAFESIDHIFDRGLDIPARSMGDVLAGLVAIANNVSAFTHYHRDAETEERMEGIAYKVRRRLYSLRGYVERLAGVSSDTLGGNWCFSSELDPFTNGHIPLAVLNVDALDPEAEAA